MHLGRSSSWTLLQHCQWRLWASTVQTPGRGREQRPGAGTWLCVSGRCASAPPPGTGHGLDSRGSQHPPRRGRPPVLDGGRGRPTVWKSRLAGFRLRTKSHTLSEHRTCPIAHRANTTSSKQDVERQVVAKSHAERAELGCAFCVVTGAGGAGVVTGHGRPGRRVPDALGSQRTSAAHERRHTYARPRDRRS